MTSSELKYLDICCPSSLVEFMRLEGFKNLKYS